ncbi:hypothetical protein SAMN05880593_102298 [Rhizobium sp. RU36D]|nr:hypothetical protein SAMN05880593_102298 [Rhizobium sp. RU36D]
MHDKNKFSAAASKQALSRVVINGSVTDPKGMATSGLFTKTGERP